jgi:hypothetical protein
VVTVVTRTAPFTALLQLTANVSSTVAPSVTMTAWGLAPLTAQFGAMSWSSSEYSPGGMK